MNPAIETMFGPESKLCACGLEVIHQQPGKTIQPHVIFSLFASISSYYVVCIFGFLATGYTLVYIF